MGGGELDAGLGRAEEGYLRRKGRSELKGRHGGTFHLRGRALQDQNSITDYTVVRVRLFTFGSMRKDDWISLVRVGRT